MDWELFGDPFSPEAKQALLEDWERGYDEYMARVRKQDQELDRRLKLAGRGSCETADPGFPGSVGGWFRLGRCRKQRPGHPRTGSR